MEEVNDRAQATPFRLTEVPVMLLPLVGKLLPMMDAGAGLLNFVWTEWIEPVDCTSVLDGIVKPCDVVRNENENGGLVTVLHDLSEGLLCIAGEVLGFVQEHNTTADHQPFVLDDVLQLITDITDASLITGIGNDEVG